MTDGEAKARIDLLQDEATAILAEQGRSPLRYLAFVAQVRMVVGALPISLESSSMNKTRSGASPLTENGTGMTPHTGH